MSKNHEPLFRVMESMAYPESDIVRVASALGASYRGNASRGTELHAMSGRTELKTPMQAASESYQIKRMIAQVDGIIKDATHHTFALTPDRPVDEAGLRQSLRKAGASPETRISILSTLAQCGLIN